MSATTTESINFYTLRLLKELDDAVLREVPVKWEDDFGNLREGVIRHGYWRVVDGDPRGYIGSDENVFDAHVRISGTMELWLPVRDVLAKLDEGLFALDF